MHRLAAGLVVSVLAASPVLAQTDPPRLAHPASSLTQAAQGPATEAVEPSLGSLFTGLATDLRRLPSVETAVILGVGGGASLVARPNDQIIARGALSLDDFEEALDSGTALGSGWVQMGGAFATYALGRVMRNARVAIVGADLVRAQIINTAITQAIKVAVDRTRPDGSSFSFPSGHTSSAFATAAVLHRHFGWKVGAPAYAAAAYIGSSRLSENKHYLSDVIFGAAIGTVVGRTVSIGHGHAPATLAVLTPPAGLGIGMTWNGAR